MSEAPEKVWLLTEQIILRNAWIDATPHEYMVGTASGGKSGGTSYTRTDLYDEAVRQRDECAAILRHISNKTGQYWNFGLELQQRITAALVACDAPPLARGDVKTGKVITSAELIEATDTPEIRGAVAPEGGGRHT